MSKILLTDKSNPWLHGFRDPVAKLSVLPSGIELAPTAGDGENRLIVGDFLTSKVIGFKGINIEWTIHLDLQIIGLTYFHPSSVRTTSKQLLGDEEYLALDCCFKTI